MALKTINSADFKSKKVIARFDFNVPLKDGQIADPTRIERALPTINAILEGGCSKLILMSHLGRPKGEFAKELSLEPVATYLASKLGEEVILSGSCTDSSLVQLLRLNTTKIVLLENLRFHPEEKNNDSKFAKTLASYADIYVNDAFGTAHREHASTHKINAFFPKTNYAGLLLMKEVESLSRIIKNPQQPFMAIIGGAKVSDKIKTLEALLPKVAKLFIGGAMAYPFLKAQGINTGKSLCSDTDVELAQKILKQDKGNKIILPLDHLASTSIEGAPQTINSQEIPGNLMALDIGPRTLELFQKELSTAKTVFWNGPMGLFENKEFAQGTFSVAKILSESNAFSVVGGGDSVSAVNKSGLASKISHVSTGGGATLEYIEKGDLPGIRALSFGVEL